MQDSAGLRPQKYMQVVPGVCQVYESQSRLLQTSKIYASFKYMQACPAFESLITPAFK